MDRRLRGFDGIRAIAIIGIVLYHIMPEIVPGGFIGVNGFFVIMGFFMVYSAGEKPESFSASKYYQKKIKRLYPSLLAMISITLIALLIFARNYRKTTLLEITSVVLGYNNFYQIFANSSYFTRMMNSSPFTHLWYLGLTIQYYLIWPLLFVIGRRIIIKTKKAGKPIIIALLIIFTAASAYEMAVLYSPKVDPSRVYYGTDSRAFALFLGMLLAYILKLLLEKRGPIQTYSKILLWRKTTMLSVLFLVALGALLKISLYLRGEDAIAYRGIMQASSALFAALILLVIFDQDRLATWLDFFLLRIIGKYSYEIYLVMYPVIFFMNMKYKGLFGKKYVFETCFWIVVFAAIIKLIPILVLMMSARIERRTEYKPAKKAFIAVAMSMCFVISTLQTSYAFSLGGTDDMEEMQALMKENEELLASSQKSQREAKIYALINLINEVRVKVNQNTADGQTDSTQQPTQQPAPSGPTYTAPSNGVTAIGDSVMLGAAQSMMNTMPGILIDAKVSRQVKAGIEIASSMNASGALGSKVIIHLGTNGAPSVQRCLELIDTIGTERQIFWVNTHGVNWEGQANQNIAEAASQRGNVTIIDWNAYSQGHREWFYSDGIHLNGEGRQAYAELIKASIGY